MDNKKIGEFITILRKEKNLTQKELASKLYVSDKAVSKWERGICMPDIALIEKLANILEVSVSDILKGEKIKNITKSNSDQIVKESVTFFQANYFKRKVIKIILLALISLTIGYILLLTVGELNNGEIKWSVWGNKSSLEVPTFSLIKAKKNTKLFLKAFKNHDYDTINLMLTENVNREYDYYTDWITRKKYFELMKEIKEERMQLANYKLLYCNPNYYINEYSIDYNCAFSLIFNYKNVNYRMGVELNHQSGKINFNKVYLNYDNYHYWNNKAERKKEYESIYNLENRELLNKLETIFFNF